MSALADLQRQFLAALAGDETADVLALIDDRHVDAVQRFAIYRNNWRSNLRNALCAAYPVVERLVGAEFFGWLADNYVDQQPSRSGNLDDYGFEFPEFIRQFPAVAELPYLADVARLEWLADAVMAAPDIAIDVDVDALTELPPHIRLMQSHYPVHRIWQVNQPDWQGDESVSLEEGAVNLLIQRRTILAEALCYELVIQPLNDEQFSVLQN